MAAGAGCSNVSSYAVPVGPGPLAQPRSGAVSIFATTQPTVGRELGIVEAQGRQDEVGVEVLFPELIARVQELGGNALVLDSSGARFRLIESWQTRTTTVPCGYRIYCSRVETFPVVYEEMSVVLRGRAWLLPEGAP